MAEWLAPRGLSFNEAKTRIVTLEDGFDFLGFTVRRHAGKLITRPSKAAIKRVKHRLAAEMRALRGGNPAAVLAKIDNGAYLPKLGWTKIVRHSPVLGAASQSPANTRRGGCRNTARREDAPGGSRPTPVDLISSYLL